MSKKDNKNYYNPSKYNIYRNASKVMNTGEELEEYSVHNDEYYYRQIQAENNRHIQNNGENIKPPVNVKPVIPEKKHYSVYDEIAERRKKQKEQAFQQEKTFDMPLSEKDSQELIDKVSKMSQAENFDEEPTVDIEAICEYYRKKYSRKMWMVLICSLIFYCLLIGGMYLYIVGYFDNWINYL